MSQLSLPTPSEYSPESIINFWFYEVPKAKWFGGGSDLDALLEERFKSWNQLAHDRELDSYKVTPHGALSLILLLDQFNRNIYRGTADMFRSDDYCVELVDYSLEHHFDRVLIEEEYGRDKLMFLSMPLMHTEDLKRQDLLLEKIDEWELTNKDFALLHRKDIERFGRFPSRNGVLGRESTQEEVDYLNDPDSWFNRGKTNIYEGKH